MGPFGQSAQNVYFFYEKKQSESCIKRVVAFGKLVLMEAKKVPSEENQKGLLNCLKELSIFLGKRL